MFTWCTPSCLKHTDWLILHTTNSVSLTERLSESLLFDWLSHGSLSMTSVFALFWLDDTNWFQTHSRLQTFSPHGPPSLLHVFFDQILTYLNNNLINLFCCFLFSKFLVQLFCVKTKFDVLKC